MKRFEVFHQQSLTRILKMQWFFHVSNEEVLKRADIRSIKTFISAARLCWYGHVVRMPENRLLKFLLNWRPNYGKWSRGRNSKNWNACVLEDVAKFTSEHNINSNGVQALTADRVQWRYMIRRERDVCDAGHSND